MNLDYITNEFIRTEVGIHGARISDQECEAICAEVQRLYDQGKFYHTGIYWVTNRMAADEVIHPYLPKSFQPHSN